MLSRGGQVARAHRVKRVARAMLKVSDAVAGVGGSPCIDLEQFRYSFSALSHRVGVHEFPVLFLLLESDTFQFDKQVTPPIFPSLSLLSLFLFFFFRSLSQDTHNGYDLSEFLPRLPSTCTFLRCLETTRVPNF